MAADEIEDLESRKKGGSLKTLRPVSVSYLMALKGFLSFSCHTPLCCSCHYGGEWKTPERMNEMGESGAADAELLQHCCLFTAPSFINKTEALWTFGGVMNSLAGSH